MTLRARLAAAVALALTLALAAAGCGRQVTLGVDPAQADAAAHVDGGTEGG